MNRKTNGNSYIFILYLLAFLAGFGPFITDFYLAALPQIALDLHCSDSLAQLTLTMGMMGLGIGQFLFGPLADQFGRKATLLFSLIIFIFFSIGCFTAQNIQVLLFCRFGQGLSGGGCMVLSRAIAVDLYRGKQLIETFSIIGAITGISPIIAPLLGGLVLAVTSWKFLFLGLLLLGCILLLSIVFFEESLKKKDRTQLSLTSTLSSYGILFSNKKFMLYVGIQSLAHGVMFAYISSSPFLFQDWYKITPFQYSFLFGLNASFIFLGSLLLMRLNGILGILKKATILLSSFAALLALGLLLKFSLIYIEVFLICIMFCLGILYPASTSLGMSLEPKHSGVASGIFGATSFLTGALVSPISGLGDMFVLTSIIIVVCSFLASICSFILKTDDSAEEL